MCASICSFSIMSVCVYMWRWWVLFLCKPKVRFEFETNHRWYLISVYLASTSKCVYVCVCVSSSKKWRNSLTAMRLTLCRACPRWIMNARRSRKKKVGVSLLINVDEDDGYGDGVAWCWKCKWHVKGDTMQANCLIARQSNEIMVYSFSISFDEWISCYSLPAAHSLCSFSVWRYPLHHNLSLSLACSVFSFYHAPTLSQEKERRSVCPEQQWNVFEIIKNLCELSKSKKK